MSSQAGIRRPIEERTTTTILKHEFSELTAPVDDEVESSPISPPAGKRWWITNAIAWARYDGDPGSDVGGGTYGLLQSGSEDTIFIGSAAYHDLEEAVQPQGITGAGVWVEEGDEIIMLVDNNNGPSTTLTGGLSFNGFEYDALS